MNSTEKAKTYHSIIRKALRVNRHPFHEAGDQLIWNGQVNARRKSTGAEFALEVELSIKPSRYTREPLKACLCKSEGVAVKDLQIAAIVDTRLTGKAVIKAPVEHQEYGYAADIAKFIAAMEQGEHDASK